MTDEAPPRRRLDDRTWPLVLTGAGVSAESGLATFRASGGAWENEPVEKVASPAGFREGPSGEVLPSLWRWR